MIVKSKLILVFSLCTFIVLTLSACTPKYVYYRGIELESSKLSEDTLTWLEKLNELPKEEQGNTNYIPTDLETILIEKGLEEYIPGKKTEEVVFEKPAKIITKVLTVEKWTEKVTNKDGKEVEKEFGKFLIYTDDLYWCEYENVDKLKPGYHVEILYSEGVKTEGEIITIKPKSVTIISATYNYFGLYLDVIDSLWNENKALNENVSAVLVDFADFKFFTDNHKTALFYLLSDKYGVEFKEGSEETQGENELVIRLHLGEPENEEYIYSLAAVKKKNDTELVKFSNCIVKNIENQLIWEKK